jgi:hypothetical protein
MLLFLEIRESGSMPGSNYPYIDKQQKLAIGLKGSSLKARNGDVHSRVRGSVRMKETPSFEDTPLCGGSD